MQIEPPHRVALQQAWILDPRHMRDAEVHQPDHRRMRQDRQRKYRRPPRGNSRLRNKLSVAEDLVINVGLPGNISSESAKLNKMPARKSAALVSICNSTAIADVAESQRRARRMSTGRYTPPGR